MGGISVVVVVAEEVAVVAAIFSHLLVVERTKKRKTEKQSAWRSWLFLNNAFGTCPQHYIDVSGAKCFRIIHPK
jgi:hypothetical protein